MTVTLELFQPAALAAGLAAEVMVGTVVSMFTVSVAVALFPALSVPVPFTAWFAPWVVRVVGPEQVDTPEVASVQAKLTVTDDLFQPKLSATGVWLGVMVGSVLSRLMVTEVDAVLPALSVAVPVTI